MSIERLATHPTLLFTGTIPYPALVSENVQKMKRCDEETGKCGAYLTNRGDGQVHEIQDVAVS